MRYWRCFVSFLIELRDKFSLFWNMVFPLIILVILIQVFGGMTEVAESVVLDISIVNQTNTDLSHESTGFHT